MSLIDPSRSRHVAAIAFPGRGHINSMLNLSRLLISSSPNLLISFIVTDEWLRLLSSGDPPPPSPTENLRFVTINNVIPSEIGRAKDYAGFLEAVFTKMEEPFERLLDRMQPAVEGIVADAVMPWVVSVGNRRNIPVYSLFTMAASLFSVLYHFDRIRGLAVREGHVTGCLSGEVDEPLGNYIPGYNSVRLSDIHSIINSTGPARRNLEAFSMVKKAQCVLVTSFYELEALVIDALRENLHCPIYPIGPSIPYMIPNSITAPTYIEWLNSQPKQSVLYVSLGSFLSVSTTQMDEIAMGLCLSGTRFLWIVREDSSSTLQETLGDMGILLPWCDQLRVLNHSSIGGFLTHCGWNSTTEGVFCGVPMLTFPIFGDQPVNSRLIVDEWKIGLSLKDKVGRAGVVGREDIALVVKKLMDLERAESKEMRSRARELRDSAHRAIEGGGSSVKNLETFLGGLMQGECCSSGL